ncbi:adenosylmethionine--8-amino-7-oxononanoate transaminase [Litorivicinus lipolyticus]|uniref:adenosylmethionine--8-amino-7-oxononanoate transaminase n=1 Tax=Litorivicinus lipolyticus TaxID=418701 RepID=UPI003B59241C
MSRKLWLPYAQMATAPALLSVANAQGVHLELADGRRLIDSISSWWSVIHGYAHPVINQAAKEQIDQFAHVMMCGLGNDPAEALAEALVRITPDPLQHVFFSDSGSTGVEVAMKMAVQYWFNQDQPKTRFMAFRGAYHGDTTACMSVGDPDEGMHSRFRGLAPQQIFAPMPPECGDCDLNCGHLAEVEALLAQHAHELAAVIIEPLVQCAGGFKMHSPAFLQRLRELTARYQTLLIFDEVATGFGRTGTMFALDQAGVCPDLLVLGKGLTCGYSAHAATLASRTVYAGFEGTDGGRAFMHGPTFMGNALACRIALAGLSLFADEGRLTEVGRIENQLTRSLSDFQVEGVVGTRVKGAIGVIEVDDPARLQGAQAYAMERGVWLRPFDRVLYTMPPYIITPPQMERVVHTMRGWCETEQFKRAVGAGAAVT